MNFVSSLNILHNYADEQNAQSWNVDQYLASNELFFLNLVATKPFPSLPLKVRASDNGEVKEMIPNGRGSWAAVS